MLKDILCDDCKKPIGLIEDDAYVCDSDMGIGIEKFCSQCKMRHYSVTDLCNQLLEENL